MSKSTKLNSRKFIVWLTATIFLIGALALSFITKDQALALEFAPWWGGISMVYIGGNVAQKFVTKPEENNEE